MKAILTERNLVAVLFVMVLITFSLAQEDTKKMEKIYTGANATTTAKLVAGHLTMDIKNPGTHSSQE
jgi:hypothetical protein